MQFDPEESGEERRKRQRDYHSYLDWQVESRKKGPATDSDAEAARLPALPPAGRLKHQPISLPYGVNAAPSVRRGVRVSVPGVSGSLSDGSGPVARGWVGGAADRSEYLSSLEDRLEAEVQRRHLVERKVALLSQKVENWVTDSSASISSLGARDAVVTEVREKARNLDNDLAALREWRNRMETTLSLAPKVQEMTQQQIAALEEEARTRIQADEARAVRFRQTVERVAGDVQMLEGRLAAEENGTLQRVAKLESSLTEEAKGARQATRQLREQVEAFGATASGAEDKASSLHQALRLLDKRQQEQQLAGAAARTEDRISRQEMQESLMSTTSEQLATLKITLSSEFSGAMVDTAKRVVDSTNVSQAITALSGRVELNEGRLNNIADNSFASLEEELNGVRAEVGRLERQVTTGPVAASLDALATSTREAQAEAQSQLTELQDALSAEITARRRNALRLAKAQAETKEGGRESTVQVASGLRARCLELEELVARLTRDIHNAQEELSSQTQTQLATSQERNSRAVSKLEDSLAGIRGLIAQQLADQEITWTKGTARVDELEALIVTNKEQLLDAEGRTRNALAAMEARRQAQGQQFTEKLEADKWEDMARTEAVEQALREQGDALRTEIEIGDRTNKVGLEELRGEVKGLEDKLRTFIVEAQMEESGRTHALLQEAQEQVNREIARVRQTTDRAAVDANALRERAHIEETTRIDEIQSLRREISLKAEASESRMRLWSEDRLGKERATLEEALERARAHSGIVRALLDEAVKAFSKELDILRTESRTRDVELENLFDEQVSALEGRLTEIDNGAAKKRRLNDQSKQNEVRIGEVDRRVRQAERELEDGVEVKLALSSRVSAVADEASIQRLDEQSDELHPEARPKPEDSSSEESLRIELGKTNEVDAQLQTELSAARGWQNGVGELESKLMEQIAELKEMAEAERELEDGVEVKLALSSLVSAVADEASVRRLDEQSDELHPEARPKPEDSSSEESLRIELGKTNEVVAQLQRELSAARGWQNGVGELESKLMEQIAELKEMAEAANSAAAAATAEAVAAREATAKANAERDASARRKLDAIAADVAREKEEAAASAARQKTEEPGQETEESEEEEEEPGQGTKRAPTKKVMDFTALNDELEAEESDQDSSGQSNEDTERTESEEEQHDEEGVSSVDGSSTPDTNQDSDAERENSEEQQDSLADGNGGDGKLSDRERRRSESSRDHSPRRARGSDDQAESSSVGPYSSDEGGSGRESDADELSHESASNGGRQDSDEETRTIGGGEDGDSGSDSDSARGEDEASHHSTSDGHRTAPERKGRTARQDDNASETSYAARDSEASRHEASSDKGSELSSGAGKSGRDDGSDSEAERTDSDGGDTPGADRGKGSDRDTMSARSSEAPSEESDRRSDQGDDGGNKETHTLAGGRNRRGSAGSGEASDSVSVSAEEYSAGEDSDASGSGVSPARSRPR